MTDPQPPAFSQDFAIDDVGDTWISMRHRSAQQWWRFVVAEKNGRKQLVHDAHGGDAASDLDLRNLAIDAYDTATLEARRRGMVD